MAADLGFASEDALREFADEHPGWWGNPNGGSMFSNVYACGREPGESVTLSDIARHWRGAAEGTPQ